MPDHVTSESITITPLLADKLGNFLCQVPDKLDSVTITFTGETNDQGYETAARLQVHGEAEELR